MPTKSTTSPVTRETAASTLLQEAQAAELQRHKARLAELKAAAAQLDLLDALRPQLQAAGITLYASELQDGRRCSRPRGLFIADGWSSTSASHPLLRALAGLGFTIEVDHDYGTWCSAWACRGRLSINLHAQNTALAEAQAIAQGSVTDDYGNVVALGPRRQCAMGTYAYHAGCPSQAPAAIRAAA